MKVTIERVGWKQFDVIIGPVQSLLEELDEEEGQAPQLELGRIKSAWSDIGDAHQVFVARTENDQIVGVLNLMESFAIYAYGFYGVINELYVIPEARSMGIGQQLIEAARD